MSGTSAGAKKGWAVRKRGSVGLKKAPGSVVREISATRKLGRSSLKGLEKKESDLGSRLIASGLGNKKHSDLMKGKSPLEREYQRIKRVSGAKKAAAEKASSAKQMAKYRKTFR